MPNDELSDVARPPVGELGPAGSSSDPRRAVLIALMMTIALAALDSTVVTTAIPSVVRDLGGFSLFPWLFSIYLLTQAVTTPIYGRCADLFGRKPVLFVGIAIFLTGSILCGLAWNMESLIVFRGLQGLGAGAIIPIAQTVVGDLYSVEERAKVNGYTASVWGMASVVGPLLGGVFSQYVSWRWIFYINLPIGVFAILLLQRRLIENVVRREHRIDYLGTVMLGTGLAALIFGLLQGGSQWPWLSIQELVVFGGGVLVLVAFTFVEQRAPEPMLPLWAFSARPLFGGCIAGIAVGAGLLGLTSYIPAWAQGVRHVDPLVAGLTVAAITVGWPISAGYSGRLYLKIGFRSTALCGAFVVLLGAGLFVTLGPSSSIFAAAAFGFIAGIGFGLTSTPIVVGIQSLVGWERRGVATSANVFGRSIGAAVGIAIFGSVANSSLKHWLSIAPRNIAADIGNSVNIASQVLGGKRTNLPPAAAEYVRLGLAHATRSVFIAIVVVAVIGLLGVCIIPKHLVPLRFKEDEIPQESADTESAVSH